MSGITYGVAMSAGEWQIILSALKLKVNVAEFAGLKTFLTNEERIQQKIKENLQFLQLD